MTIDWSVLDEDVQSVCDKAASKASATARTAYFGLDDLKQEAYILCARRPDVVSGYVERDELGLLYNDIYRDLLNLLDIEIGRQGKQISYEQLRDGVE